MCIYIYVYADEQIDRNTGVQVSSEDLTWSYAEILNAASAREIYMAKRS
jgi:GH15 family glucan-1,4-alpha-glucosidase